MATTLQITLELQLTEPISGLIGDSSGALRDFSGWLEMHAAIERICERGRQSAEENQQTEEVER